MNEDTLKKVGIKIGHYTDEKSLTGLTCFIAAAADAVVKAINNSIIHAKSVKGFPAYQRLVS